MGAALLQAREARTGSLAFAMFFACCCMQCAGHVPPDLIPGASICASLLQDRAVSSRTADVPGVAERSNSSKEHGRGAASALEVASKKTNRTIAPHDPTPAVAEAARPSEVPVSSEGDAASATGQKTYVVVVPKFEHERERRSASAGVIENPYVEDAHGVDDTLEYDFLEILKVVGYFLMAVFIAYALWHLTCRNRLKERPLLTPPPTPEKEPPRNVPAAPVLQELKPNAAGAARPNTGPAMGASGPVAMLSPSISQTSSLPPPPPPPPDPARIDSDFVNNVNRTFTYITEGHSVPNTSQSLQRGPIAMPRPPFPALPHAKPQALLASSRLTAQPVLRAASLPPSRFLQEPVASPPPSRVTIAASQDHAMVLSPLRIVSSLAPAVRPVAASSRARTVSPVPQSRVAGTVVEPAAVCVADPRLGQESHFAIRSLRGMDLKQPDPIMFDVLDVDGRPVLRAHVVLPQNWHMDPGSESWHSSRKKGATSSPAITLSKVLTGGSGELQVGPLVACCRAGGEVDGRKSMYVYDSEDKLFAVISRDAARRRYVITSTRLGLDLFFEGSFNERVSITNGHGEQLARTQAATKDADSPVLSYWLHIAPHASTLEALAICGLVSIEVDEVEL